MKNDETIAAGVKALLQCTASELGDYSPRLMEGYEADVVRVFKAMAESEAGQAEQQRVTLGGLHRRNEEYRLEVKALHARIASLEATPQGETHQPIAPDGADLLTIKAVQEYIVGVVRAFGDVSCAAYISTWHKPEVIAQAILTPCAPA